MIVLLFAMAAAHLMGERDITRMERMLGGQTALLGLADGNSGKEATTIYNTLKGAGVNVTRAKVGSGSGVTFQEGTKMDTDISISEAKGQSYDLVVIPGGVKGAEALAGSGDMISILKS